MVNWLRSLFKRAEVYTVTYDDFASSAEPGDFPVNDETALTCSAVYRATAIISQCLAGLPVSVVRVKGKKVETVPHPVADLLNVEFNPSEGSVLGRERIQAAALLGKAGYAEIVRMQDGVGLAQLRVIDSSRVQATWSQNPATKQWLRYFRVDHGAFIPDDRMIQIPGFGFDGLEGTSIVRQAADAIGHSKLLERYGKGNFQSGTAPRGVLKTSATLTAEDKVRMRTSWKTVHSQPNDIAILDEDYEFKPIDINNEDRQFLQSRSFQVVEIARWFGVPPHMLAELKDANYNTTEQMGSEFKTLTLQPWVNRWEQETTRKLLTRDERRDGLRVVMDMDGLLRADYVTRMNGHRIAISTGLKTIDECRAEEELPPTNDPRTSQHLIPLNMAGIDEPSEPATANNPK